jgi:tryptophan synthase alpha chain
VSATGVPMARSVQGLPSVSGAGSARGAAPGIAMEPWLRERRAGGTKLLVPYVMGGMTGEWVEVVQAVVAAGADAVEVGIPFSDPMMDGPVIQEASVRALERGTTPSSVVDGLAGAGIGVPVAVMTYYNIVFRAGHRRFAQSLRGAGISAAIVPDLSLEELGPWAQEADEAGVATVLLVAPSSGEERVRRICDRCRGFVYAVARMGVTGERASLGADAATVVERVRRATDAPVCVGVGVSNADHAREVCRVADGVVIGSALVRRVLEGGGPDAAAAFVGEVRAALDAAG